MPPEFNLEEKMRNIVEMAQKSMECENALQQEKLAEQQKYLTTPKKKYYKLEGYFSAIQLEELSKFLKGDIFNE